MDVVRGQNNTPKRYLSISPRAEWMSGRVKQIDIDPDTGSIHQLVLEDVTGNEAMAEMTADVGTQPGASDIGRVRVRFASSGSTSNKSLPIGLTAKGALGVAVGHYVTVREEFRPWEIGYRLVPVYDGGGLIVDVLEYFDYDGDFGAPHSGVTPKAQIEGAHTSDFSVRKTVRPADWVDDYGKPSEKAYRTLYVTCSGSFKQSFWNTGNPGIASVLWDVGDCTIITGSDTNSEITIRVPVGFRYIHATVTDDDGFEHTMHFPLWAHNDEYPPLTIFNITRDETEGWREQTIEFFGNADDVAEGVIPAGCGGCYWEDLSDLFADGPAPEAYRDHAYGWITEETTLLRSVNSTYTVTLAGIGWWLDHFDGPTQALRGVNDSETPASWYQVKPLTRNKATYFSLLHFCNAASLVNIYYPSGEFTGSSRAVNLPPATIWQQNMEVAERFTVSVLGSDSFGNLYIEREYNHRSAAERVGILPLVDLTAEDWTEDGIALTVQFAPNVSRVDGAGSIRWLPNDVLYASAAPGKTKTWGTTKAELPGQYLPGPAPQAALNELTGQRLAVLNNPSPEFPVQLMNNLDAIEPCYQRPIRITWQQETPRGTRLVLDTFMVKRVEVQHSFDVDGETPGKSIIWHVQRTTLGLPGQKIDVIQAEGVTPPPEILPEPVPLLRAGAKTIMACRKGGSVAEYYITHNWDAASPAWTTVSLASALPGHSILEFEPDPFSPYYVTGSGAVNGWLVTLYNGINIYKLNNVFGTPSLSIQHNFPGGVNCFIQAERGMQGWVGIKYLVQVGGATPAGIYVGWTTDGVSWQSENKTPGVTGNNFTPGLQLLYDVPGALLVDIDNGINTSIYASSDFGDTLSLHPLGANRGGAIHRPFSAPPTTFYTGNTLAAELHLIEGGVDTDVTLIISGTRYIPSGTNRSLKSYDLNRDYMAIAGFNNCAISTNRLASGTKINGGISTYTACNFAGDDPDYTYWWNVLSGGQIAARNGSGNAVSKAGAGGTAIAGGANIGICNICGGPDP